MDGGIFKLLMHSSLKNSKATMDSSTKRTTKLEGKHGTHEVHLGDQTVVKCKTFWIVNEPRVIARGRYHTLIFPPKNDTAPPPEMPQLQCLGGGHPQENLIGRCIYLGCAYYHPSQVWLDLNGAAWHTSDGLPNGVELVNIVLGCGFLKTQNG